MKNKSLNTKRKMFTNGGTPGNPRIPYIYDRVGDEQGEKEPPTEEQLKYLGNFPKNYTVENDDDLTPDGYANTFKGYSCYYGTDSSPKHSFQEIENFSPCSRYTHYCLVRGEYIPYPPQSSPLFSKEKEFTEPSEYSSCSSASDKQTTVSIPLQDSSTCETDSASMDKSPPKTKKKRERKPNSKGRAFKIRAQRSKITQAYQQRNIHKSVLKNIISYNNTIFNKKQENVKYGRDLVLAGDQFLKTLDERVVKKSDHKKIIEDVLKEAVVNDYIMDLVIECLELRVKEMENEKYRSTISLQNRPHYKQIYAAQLYTFNSRKK